MEWPIRYLLVLLCLAATAVFAPWFIPRTRRGLLIEFVGALAVTAVWISYENHLHSIARPGDPLIRIDLLVITPLIALDWISAVAAFARGRLTRRNDKTIQPSGSATMLARD